VVKYPPFRTIIYIYIYIRKGKKETPPHPIGDNYTHPFPFFFFYLKLKSFLRNDFREAVVLLKATTFPCAGTRMGTPVVRSGSFPHETGGGGGGGGCHPILTRATAAALVQPQAQRREYEPNRSGQPPG